MAVMSGGMEEETYEPEFPEELDEFLQYCVEEHGEDFEAISHDFMDIASELEGELVERAHDFFSPEALRQRWRLLNGEDPCPPAAINESSPEPAASAVAPVSSSAPVASSVEPIVSATTAASSSSLGSTPAMPADRVQEAAGVTPSNFSIFRDSLKEQIDKIYSDVQNHLPTTLDADEDEDNSDEEVKIFDSDGGHPRLVSPQAKQTTVDVPSTLLHGVSENTADERTEASADVASGASDDKLDLTRASPVDYDLRQRALELFGTDDLSEIFPDLPADALPGVDGQPDLSHASSPQGIGPGLSEVPSGLLAGLSQAPPASSLGAPNPLGGSYKAPSNELPSFDAVLLSHGVNPRDIDGPLVELPEQVKGIFDQLKQGLDEGRDFSGSSGARKSRAAEADGPKKAAQVTQQVKSKPSPSPAPQAPAPEPSKLPKHQTELPSRAGKDVGKGSGKGKDKGVGNNGVDGKQSADTDSSGDDATEDSADEDFAQMRRSAKTSSLNMVNTQDSPSSAERPASQGGPRSMKFAPPARPVRPSPARHGVTSPSSQKFVKLELVESSDEDDDEEQNDDDDSGSGPENGSEHDEAESLSVMRRLLRRAPSGECQWDVWLDATRKWPRLGMALGGSPTFFRRDGNLKVAFDVEKLRSVLDEHTKEYAERKRKEAEEAERQELGLSDYVQEAERHREKMRSRLGDGFVLTSRSRVLEEKHAETQRKQKEQEAAEERERKEKERKAKEKQEREQEKQRKVEEARLQQEQQQEQERLRLQREADARSRELRIEEIAKEVQRHRCPLYERHVSLGPAVPGLSAETREAFESGMGAGSVENPFAVYLVPWGNPGRAFTAPSKAQGELLSLLCSTEGLVQAMLLVQADAVVEAGGTPDAMRGCAMVVLLLLNAALAQSTLTSAMPGGQAASNILSGPFPADPLGRLFMQPLALWAGDHSVDAAVKAKGTLRCTAETVCIALRPGVGRLAAVLAEVHQEGLVVVGLRLVFADEAIVQTATSVALKGVVQAGRPTLLVAIRGPQALGLWRNLLGPGDPELARHTDPLSLNARFGGQGRSEAIALNPPSSTSKAFTDVIWGFGGRVDPESAVLPTNPVCALLLSAPALYAARISGCLQFSTVGSLLHGLLLRAGDVQGVSIDGSSSSSGLIVTAVREGGGGFLDACTGLLAPASGNASRDPPPITATLCDVPKMVVSAPSSKALYEQAYQFGEPEVLIIGFRPRVTISPAFREACDGLFAKFGTGGTSSGDHLLPPGLCIGSSVDLLAVRLLDFGAGASTGTDGPVINPAGIETLREFRSFMQVVRRAPDNASDTWWAAGASGRAGPAAFLCLRGEGVIGRFVTFLSKEWKLPAAVAGDVFFTPSPRVAFSAYTALFGGLSCLSPFEPTVPQSDLRAEARFCPDRQARSAALSEAALFPRRVLPQLTPAVLLPPCDDWFLSRVLTSAEQSGFTLLSAAISGGLREDTARLIFDQEVEDEHLEADEWEAFRAAAGCDADDEEGEFKSLWLVFSRHQGIKRFAQLCGHGDPAVNQRHLKATLRQPPRERLQNGIRCATSCATASALLGQLAVDLQPRLKSPTAGGRLGIEAGSGRPDIALVAVASQSAEFGLMPILRELASKFAERGLALVGLRAVAGSIAVSRPEQLEAEDAPSAQAAASWVAPASMAADEAMRCWKDIRAAATRLADAAGQGASVVLAACEGNLAIEHARAAVLAVSSTAGPSTGDAGGVEIYSSATAAEGAADVAHFFSDLFGAKHYVVASDLD